MTAQLVIEKPTASTVHQCLDESDNHWNSGMFKLNASIFLQPLEHIRLDNVPENEGPLQGLHLPFRMIRNAAPKGFGENHNEAYAQSTGDYFIAVNPDIRLPVLDVERLLAPMKDP